MLERLMEKNVGRRYVRYFLQKLSKDSFRNSVDWPYSIDYKTKWHGPTFKNCNERKDITYYAEIYDRLPKTLFLGQKYLKRFFLMDHHGRQQRLKL